MSLESTGLDWRCLCGSHLFHSACFEDTRRREWQRAYGLRGREEGWPMWTPAPHLAPWWPK